MILIHICSPSPLSRCCDYDYDNITRSDFNYHYDYNHNHNLLNYEHGYYLTALGHDWGGQTCRRRRCRGGRSGATSHQTRRRCCRLRVVAFFFFFIAALMSADRPSSPLSVSSSTCCRPKQHRRWPSIIPAAGALLPTFDDWRATRSKFFVAKLFLGPADAGGGGSIPVTAVAGGVAELPSGSIQA